MARWSVECSFVVGVSHTGLDKVAPTCCDETFQRTVVEVVGLEVVVQVFEVDLTLNGIVTVNRQIHLGRKRGEIEKTRYFLK